MDTHSTTQTEAQITITTLEETIAELERKYEQTGDFFTRLAISEMRGKLASEQRKQNAEAGK